MSFQICLKFWKDFVVEDENVKDLDRKDQRRGGREFVDKWFRQLKKCLVFIASRFQEPKEKENQKIR